MLIVSLSLFCFLSADLHFCPQQKVHHKKTEAKNKNEDENMHRSKCTHVNDQTEKNEILAILIIDHRPSLVLLMVAEDVFF